MNNKLDALRAEVALLTAERDAARAELDEAHAECDALRAMNTRRAAAARKVAAFCRAGWRVVGGRGWRQAVSTTIRPVWRKER